MRYILNSRAWKP